MRHLTLISIVSVVQRLERHLSQAEYKATSKLVHYYADVFSRSEFDLERTEALPHRIDTGDSRPIKQPLRRNPKIHEYFIDENVSYRKCWQPA